MENNYASIDVGTHTTRLLIACLKDNNALFPLTTKRIITKLGLYVENQVIKETAYQRLEKALNEFKKEMDKYKVSHYRAVATAILRIARNKCDIIRKIEKNIQIQLEVIDGQTEALLTAKGVLATLNILKWPALIVDIGGGSTEVILLKEDSVLFVKSLPLGASVLTKQYLKTDPPLNQEVNQAFREIKAFLTQELSPLSRPAVLIGTAGTVSTLAAIDLSLRVYQPSLVNGHVISKTRIKEIWEMLVGLPAVKRTQIAGLEKGREEIILGGLIIVLSLMDVLGQEELVVSEGGLLEGALVDHLETKKGIKGLKFIY